MLIKLVAAALILVAVFMGVKQGWAMLLVKPPMLELFGRWHFSPTAIRLNGLITLVSAGLILFPRTFVWGNFGMAASILLLICFHLLYQNVKGAAIELPFLALNLLILYLGHPFSGTT